MANKYSGYYYNTYYNYYYDIYYNYYNRVNYPSQAQAPIESSENGISLSAMNQGEYHNKIKILVFSHNINEYKTFRKNIFTSYNI